MALAQQRLDLRGCRSDLLFIARLDHNRRYGRFTVRLVSLREELADERRNRHDDAIVRRAERVSTLGPEHTDHAKTLPLDPDRLPDRTLVGKESFRDPCAQDRHICGPSYVALGDKLARGH